MRHKQYREVLLAAQLFEKPQNRRLRYHVERRRRLVGEHQPRLAGERERYRGALFLPAGELVRVAARYVRGQLDLAEQLRGAPFRLFAFYPEMHLEHLFYVAAYRHYRCEGVQRPLRHERDFALAQGRELAFGQAEDVPPLVQNFAARLGSRGQQAEQRHQHRAFAASRLAYEAAEGVLRDGEGDVLHGLVRRAARVVCHG